MNRSEPILDDEYYHVYNRGNRRQPIFGDESDYLSFIGKISEACWKYKVFVVVYALIPNHFHFILLQPKGGSIARLMDSVETSAAKRFDLKYREVGHLFQGRYRYDRIDSEESLLVVARYIHLNPVTSGLVRHAEDWPYSDFQEHVEDARQMKASFIKGNSSKKDAFSRACLLPSLNRGEGSLLPCTPKEYLEFVRSLSESVLHQG